MVWYGMVTWYAVFSIWLSGWAAGLEARVLVGQINDGITLARLF